jgi:hypothetical protein
MRIWRESQTGKSCVLNRCALNRATRDWYTAVASGRRGTADRIGPNLRALPLLFTPAMRFWVPSPLAGEGQDGGDRL